MRIESTNGGQTGSGGRNPLLTWQDIEAYKSKINPQTGKHFKQSEIAQLYGVTRAYISKILSQAPAGMVSRTHRQIAMDDFPIKNCPGMASKNSLYQTLRFHGYYVSDPHSLNDEQFSRLRLLHRRLVDKGLIVVFDPELHPTPSNVSGYLEYRPRIIEDGDLLIRDNEHVVYTPAARRIYRLPSKAL